MEILNINAFEVSGLCFSYGQKEIFNKFNLSHYAGEISLWNGPSGLGKTTLANLICGYLNPEQGHVKIFNNSDITPNLNRLLVSHKLDLFAWQTFRQHYLFLIKNKSSHIKLSESQVEFWARELEIFHLFDKYPQALSMGQARRFQILRSFILSSDIIFFDETFSSLDLEFKNKIMPKLYQFWKERKISVVIISHESANTFNLKFDTIHDMAKLIL